MKHIIMRACKQCNSKANQLIKDKNFTQQDKLFQEIIYNKNKMYIEKIEINFVQPENKFPDPRNFAKFSRKLLS